MKNLLPFLILILGITACSEDPSVADTFTDEKRMEVINRGMTLFKNTTQSSLNIILQYPEIHGGFHGGDDVENRSLCPDITPDPSLPVASYPVEYNLDFNLGCTPVGTSHDISGDIKVTLDGQICVANGASMSIVPQFNFRLNGNQLVQSSLGDFKITLINIDEDGNLSFGATIQDLACLDSESGEYFRVLDVENGIMKLLDVNNNNDTSNPITFFDDIIEFSFDQMDGISGTTTFDITQSSPLVYSPFCGCPVSGTLVITDSLGDTNTLNYDGNSDCSGTATLNGLPYNLNGICM